MHPQNFLIWKPGGERMNRRGVYNASTFAAIIVFPCR